MATQLLQGCAEEQKTAYIAAIASIATTDNVASENEINYLVNLADYAGLNDQSKKTVLAAAKDTSLNSLKQSLDVLKSSELRFSLVADLIAFAEADSNLAEGEKKHIESISNYLGVNNTQLQALNDYVKEAASQPVAQPATTNTSMGSQGILGGISDKLTSAGIDFSSVAKGLMSFVGPMIMGNMISKGMQSGGRSDIAQGNTAQGGIGSLVSSLTGGKGLSGIGGFLSKLM
ncbi:MAG: TerB family tellurite resistance protein [Chitinophagales bacterium]|nr:TerB family tellurite resistance protein [Chitinophagales bacterium]